MSHIMQHPDESQLTAFVLEELSASERAEIDAHLSACESCRTLADECRQTTAILFEALQSEPVPALSEAQREMIRQAADPSTTRPSMKLTSPAPSGRRGIVPLLGAAIACAALLIGVSLHDFDRPAFETAAQFDDTDSLLALNDGLAMMHESAPKDLIQLSRFDSELAGRASGSGVDKSLDLKARELNEIPLVQEGVSNRLGSSLRVQQAERLSRESLVEEKRMLGQQMQELATTTTTRPAAPGNLGDVTEFATDRLHRGNSAGVAGAAPTSTPTPVPTPRRNAIVNSPAPASGQARGGAATPFGATPGDPAGAKAVVEYSQPTWNYYRKLQAQDADKDGYPGGPSPAGVESQPVVDSKLPTLAAPAGGNPAAAGKQPSASKYSGSQPQGESGEVPRQRGVALQENLSVARLRFADQNGNGAWLDLSYPDSTAGTSRQFVPSFALSNLQGLSEAAPAGGGLAAGAEAVPPVISNSATFEQELLLGARLVAEEDPAANESKSRARLAWGVPTLTWEDGQWFAINQAGQKLVIGVPDSEAYAPIQENEFLDPTEAPLSTFGLDVDTASYANVRRFLMDQGRFPPPDAVRIEELVNYFSYSDPAPADDEPLAVHLESAACPWDTDHRLVRIGLQAKEIDLAERPPTTLVFLIDNSGSMRDEKKLPLVKDSLRILVDEMTENDRIAIVTYNSNASLLLDSTSGEQRDEIIAAIDGLSADGSTNGEAGLKLAYDIADKHFIKSGQNRVILCTDGDFNVGTSETDPLVGMISEKRSSGVFLSICGYGSGNIKDEKLEQIADKGNGQYHYIDGLKEARKVFLDELSGMLYTVAKDVKLQVEFNPAHVASYRLLGYENRTMAAEDFNNDRVDSGDMGAGHSVTALYEVVPVGVAVEEPVEEEAKPERPKVDPLKYRRAESVDAGESTAAKPSTLNPQPSTSNELLTVKLRYKQPDGDESVKREFPLVVADAKTSPSADLEWSAAVASFGMLLRSSQYAGQSSLEGVLELAQGARGRDESGRRREFIDMVLQTRSLVRGLQGTPSATPQELSSTEARQKATVGGKYQDLLDKLEARTDVGRYGAFHDYGWSADRTYAGREGLPAGYWVYVYPDWYIWAETVSATR